MIPSVGNEIWVRVKRLRLRVWGNRIGVKIVGLGYGIRVIGFQG